MVDGRMLMLLEQKNKRNPVKTGRGGQYELQERVKIVLERQMIRWVAVYEKLENQQGQARRLIIMLNFNISLQPYLPVVHPCLTAPFHPLPSLPSLPQQTLYYISPSKRQRLCSNCCRSKQGTCGVGGGVVPLPISLQQPVVMAVFDSLHESSGPLLDKVDAHFSHFEPLNQLAQRISVRPAYLLIGFLLVGVVMVGAGIFSHLFVALFGMIYPSYMTFKALSSGQACRTKEWLTYWIVFGFFTAFARTARYFFFFLSLSSYNVFRILLYLYLFHPATNGAAFLYNNYLRNKLVEIKQYLDQTHSKL